MKVRSTLTYWVLIHQEADVPARTDGVEGSIGWIRGDENRIAPMAYWGKMFSLSLKELDQDFIAETGPFSVLC